MFFAPFPRRCKSITDLFPQILLAVWFQIIVFIIKLVLIPIDYFRRVTVYAYRVSYKIIYILPECFQGIKFLLLELGRALDRTNDVIQVTYALIYIQRLGL